ncbi:MAG: hypothetical protein Q4C95_07050 [Planctomycetia bacterium]|nr:hypothetical protein [Planctomycetia bacterium]
MNIYNHSPIFLQNIFTTIGGYQLKRQRFDQEYRTFLNEYKQRDYSDKKRMNELHNRLFLDLLEHAVQKSPFYRDFYKDVNWDAIQSVDDIKNLPILEKETVRQNIAKMYTLPYKKAVKTNTSGTTGKSLLFLHEKSDDHRHLAYLDFFKSEHGFIALKMKKASFNSAKIVPPNQKKTVFWRDNLSTKQRFYSGYHCQGNNVQYYVENLNRYQPQAIDGYPSALYEIAKYIVDHNISLDFQPIAIFPTAEILPPHYKTLIAKAFNCPVRDQYSSSERAPFVYECRCGKLHYRMDTGVIETDEDNDIIVTCFHSRGTPLIRYRIGDQMIFADPSEKCPCGCCFPVVEKIIGRSLEYLQSKSNGRFSSVYMSLVSEDFRNSVKGMQFVQNSIDTIDIYVAQDVGYTADMDQIIIKKLQYSLGQDMNFVIHHVDFIPREKSGKFRLLKNNIIR